MEEGPEYDHLWVISSNQNVVLRVSRRKTPKCFPAGALFLVFLTKCLSKCPSSTTTSRLCNWTVICTVNLSYVSYVLHQKHSEFSHIQKSVFFRYMPGYSIIFSVIKSYSRILGHYEYPDLFRHIQHSAPVTLACSEPCHILSTGIFRTGSLFKTL